MFRETYPTGWTFHRATSFVGIVAPPLESVAPSAAPFKEYASVPLVRLPRRRPPERSLGDAIAMRASCRAFAPKPLKLADLGLLLHSGYGVLEHLRSTHDELLERPVPSPGALYPLELYVLAYRVQGLDRGTFHYAALHHGLERVAKLGPRLPPAWFLGQPFVEAAAAFLLVTARLDRVLPKYGDRGLRSVYLEAGHVVQNVALAAAASGVGALPLAGFHDEAIGRVLELDPDLEIPVYAVALGKPLTKHRLALRGLKDPPADLEP